MSNRSGFQLATVFRDLIAGLVVFLVALPLCLGVAVASNAPPLAGLIAGIIGGILVGIVSGSHTSVSGPAAGLTAVVAAQIAGLGSFQAFLLAVFLAGLFQIALGYARAGFLSSFFPSSVIKGLLAAIGVILILKQIPHLFGHDNDPEGEMAFDQPDNKNTFTELWEVLTDLYRVATTWRLDEFQVGAACVGFVSLLLLVAWDRIKPLKRSVVPAPLVVVVVGVLLSELFRWYGGLCVIEPSHLVNVPVANPGTDDRPPVDSVRGFFLFLGWLGRWMVESVNGFATLLQSPDFAHLRNSKVYLAAATIAVVASLETLLNLEAVDKLDPKQRNSPPNRELIAQGVGNAVSGLVGGLPVTSVIVRSSVNLNAGARTKLSAVIHGLLLGGCVLFLAGLLNRIPLSCLAAILLFTGFKLASLKLARQMWKEGKQQFLPFAVTVVAIVFTDLLVGVLIGLGVSIAFILRSNLRRPLRRIREKHLSGEVVRIDLANQVSFLNRAALTRAFDEVPEGGHVVIDATHTDYIDPDILDLIREFDETTGPARGVQVSLRGFHEKYQFDDRIQYVDYTSRDLQQAVTPRQVLDLLKDGNERFRTGRQLYRDLGRQVNATAAGQHPLAVLLTCIDSRSPAELIFDLGVGDIFVARVAGNVSSRKLLGSMEYATAVAGAKLVLVLGHTRCGAVTAACGTPGPTTPPPDDDPGPNHIEHILASIRQSVDAHTVYVFPQLTDESKRQLVDDVARRNVVRTVDEILEQSGPIAELARTGRVLVVGAMYDVATGGIEFLTERGAAAQRVPAPSADGAATT
jgi:carbonic anhydrase